MLTLRKSTLNKIRRHCSNELIEKVFSDYGLKNITIDEKNTINDKWEVTNYLDDETLPFVEKCKVLLSFARAFGVIVYNGYELPIEALCSVLCKNKLSLGLQMNKVLTAWLHNEINDVCPFFEYGELTIPQLMDRYICTQISDTAFQVEKWKKGEYVPINEIYPTKEQCEARVDELNEEYDEYDER